MNKRHKYDYHVASDDHNHVAHKIVQMVGQGKRVLEIGAGPGSITRILRGQAGCRITAVELDSEALPSLRPLCEQVFQRDLNEPCWSDGLAVEGGYDVIVAADVLEHLVDPWQALASLKPLLATEGFLVISLPHAGHNAVIAALLNGDFRYYEWGLLDRTHIRFFGIKNIENLFSEAGYLIDDFGYVLYQPETTELATFWHALPVTMQQALRESAFGTVYQVVIKASIAEGSQRTTLHLAPPGPVTACSLAEKCRDRLRQWLPAPIRRRLRKTLNALQAKEQGPEHGA